MLNELKQTKSYKRGDFLNIKGQPADGLYCLQSGFAKIVWPDKNFSKENYIDSNHKKYDVLFKNLDKYTLEKEKCYKMFLLPLKGGNKEKKEKVHDQKIIKYIDGKVDKIGGKNLFLFKDFDLDTTPVHELLHCLGLLHTFDPNAKYVFEKGKTDNLMDYSVITNTSSFWQWKKVNKEINNKI